MKIPQELLDVAFTKEYEVNASQKLLYPYIATASGLQQWFADSVNVLSDNRFNFVWDKQDHPAVLVSQKINKSARFEFADADVDPMPGDMLPFIEFSLETSPVSQSVFLKVTDLTVTGSDETEETWDHLISTLKEIVRG